MRRPLAALMLLASLLPGCSAGAAASGHGSPAEKTHGPVTVVVVGDSIAEADSPDFDDGEMGRKSWATYANGSGVRIVGGWAHAGATTADMLAGLTTAPTPRADILVIMAASNDLDAGVSLPEIEDHLDGIARIVDPDRVVISTIPPEDAIAATVRRFNAQLPGFAEHEGWQLIDPMRDIRDAEGRYRPGMTDDGVHPSLRAARLIGAAVHRALTR